MFKKSAAPAAAGGYTLSKSLRFRSSASAYLNRTTVSPTLATKLTVSFWTKLGTLGVRRALVTSISADSVSYWGIEFGSTNGINVYDSNGGGSTAVSTAQVFRDPSAWYHIVCAVDTTQATAANRVLIYVNGVQVTSFSAADYPSINSVPYIQVTGHQNSIGSFLPSVTTAYLDGYLSAVYFIDGQALTPSSFGAFSGTGGVWQPKAYTGTYGANGFYLPFTDTSSTTNLVKDSSGNSNNFTPNNISLTAGSTYDSMTDVPTLTSATTANYCVLNPLQNGGTLSNANLTFAGNTGSTIGTIAPSSGKWYFEATVATLGTSAYIGLADTTWFGTDTGWSYSQVYVYISSGNKGGNGSSTSYGATYTTGDVIGVAMDLDGGTITFYKNNTSQGTAFSTSVAGKALRPFLGTTSPSSTTYNVNFGQQPFAYTPPTGFVALNTYNLPTSTIVAGNKVMDATLYTGNGSTQSVTNAGSFKPDLVWVKSRSAATDHKLTDSVRGATKALISDTSGAETTDANGLTAFNANGWALGSDSAYNTNASTYVAWQWQAGQGSTSSNTNGSITSTTSVNPTAGFSVVTYTGNGVDPSTVGHGLGIAPQFCFIKNRSGVNVWQCFSPITTQSSGSVFTSTTVNIGSKSGGTLHLDTTGGAGTYGMDAQVNANGSNYVMYVWAAVPGFSTFGSYTGNGSSDGVFSYLGFKPRLVLIKRTDTTGNWIMWDTARNTYNVMGEELYPNLSNAGSTATDMDVLSNGFKLRNTTADFNANGGTYIYAAFAENPFKNSLAR
jgi:hypothetical protein